MLAAESQLIFEGSNSVVYYQEQSEYPTPVVIKVIRDEHATPEQVNAFYNEYDISQNLNIEGTRKVYQKTTLEEKAALVMEYVPGQTLRDFFEENELSLSEFLKISIKICQVLGEIHQHKIIHKDIGTKNILLDAQKNVKLIDFGISTKLSLKINQLNNPEKLEGTLAYISPEQTGRMNRVVDHRSDLYSLGVVLYELATGKLPFDSEDAMSLVHSHLAQSPVPPQEVKPEIPEIISDIILKLLRKNAEDRYQSAFGLKIDLERCLKQLEEKQKIDAFELARYDFSGRLQIPQKLYGRQKEMDFLLDSFERSCQGATELLLVTGYSGVGKSALVHEIHRPITERRGFFIEGKFDQFQRNIPYFAFIQAFKSFVNHLLTENAHELERWKKKIQKAVGNNGKILTDVMPALELIIGKQPEVPQLGSNEAQNRFNLVFQNFISVISQREHPLVIFIDDCQWADAASLNLLKILLTSSGGEYFFVIGAYRANEVDPSHPFVLTLEELRKDEVELHTLELSNLNQNHLTDLIADTLKMPEAQIADLADLVFKKTQGNAFFVNQMLKSLYEENLLRFDYEQRHWAWDIRQINELNISDDVVELMAGKIQKLPDVTQNVLKLASCVGNRFSLPIITIVDDNSSPDAIEVTRKHLEPALAEGLLIPLEEEYKFAHDRIQQAVSSLIPQEDKKQIHLRIGKLLIENIPPEKRDEHIFDIANQWNYGLELLDEEEKAFLADLNLRAGEKARASAAYRPAFNYLKIASELLGLEAWETQYELTLEVHAEMLEAVFLKGDLILTEHYIRVVLEKGKTVLDKIPAYEIQMQYHIAKGDQQEALEVGLYVVEQLQVPLAKAPRKDIEVEALIDLPQMENRELEAAMAILDSIITPAWAINPDLFEKITYTMVNLSMGHGNSASSCVGYAFYGGLLCGKLGDIELGYRYGKLAIRLLERFNAKFFESKVQNLYVSTVMHWKEPARATRKPHFDAIQVGLETGEIEFASYNIVESCHYHFLMGIDLDTMKQRYAKDRALVKQLKQHFHIAYLSPWQQMVQNLRGESEQNSLLKGEFFDEESQLPEFVAANQLTLAFVAFQAKTYLAYLFQNYEQAYTFACEAEKYRDGATGTMMIPVHNFLYSLTMIAHFPNANLEQKQSFLQQIDQNQRELKLWAYHAPSNYEHKYKLILAETMRLSGQSAKAMDYYDEAIEGAKSNRYLHEEALANELAGEFYLDLGKVKIAKAYLNDAYYGYQMWGAKGKVSHFEKKHYKYIQKNQRPPRGVQSTTAGIGASSTFSPNLDIYTIIKASQALSSEVVLGKLLQKMMRIVIENAGAEKGFFILRREDRWFIEAECNINNPEVEAMQSVPVDEIESKNPQLSLEVINYVIRTRRNLVINDAVREESILSREYIGECDSTSILCMPFIYQGKLSGLLYLENNLTTDAFTPDRLEILEILSTQITISIENALLYENLEEKVKERTAEVVKAKEIIEKKNQDITSSINYAKRIQEATLPQIEKIQGLLPESFIIFKPRDIVSGDFYWCSKVDPQPIYEQVSEGGELKKILKGYTSEKVIVTAVDCTGHGVPGAFMSMIGNDILNGLVDLRCITDPSVILREMHVGVRNALRQRVTENKDGMDMALCVIDREHQIVEFAGAKNPLIYIQDNELYHIKGDKMPVGGVQKRGERTFTTHQIALKGATSFYMFSDGYQDQFGGEQGRKFMIKRLKKLLLEIHRKPMGEQKRILEYTLERWMRGHRQIDDILVMGFRVN